MKRWRTEESDMQVRKYADEIKTLLANNESLQRIVNELKTENAQLKFRVEELE